MKPRIIFVGNRLYTDCLHRKVVYYKILTAFSAAGSEQYLEVAFAILAAFKLVENPVRKYSEALSASKIDKLSSSDDNGWFLFVHSFCKGLMDLDNFDKYERYPSKFFHIAAQTAETLAALTSQG